jgi:carboxyl-terminal processing protease
LIWLCWLIAIVLLSFGCDEDVQPTAGEVPKLVSTEPNVVEVPEFEDWVPTESTDSNIVKTTCELIYKGLFEDAGELIEQSDFKGHQPQGEQLANIIQEYRAISIRRLSARKDAYTEKLAELEKFQVTADSNDVNDVNDISKVLAAITRVSDFTNEQQKEELLSDSFVKQVFQKAIDKAAEFESKGKWLDAYTSCYWWLAERIDAGNETYSDYAEQLYEKANIVASFRDSPCETRKERYEGIKKEMFVRAIGALNFNYVSIIDYQQMATKAIRRCKLLAEVINSSSIVQDALRDTQYDTNDMEYDKKLAAWSAALEGILDKVNQSPMGVSKDKFIDIFEEVLTLNTTTVELPQPVLIEQFAEAALSTLDPYTIMVWPKQIPNFEKEMTKEFTGIGIEISKQKGLLTVASLLPDTPAYNSGLDAGDVIELVDGLETRDMSLSCAVKNITGPAGTKVTLTIRRPGEDETRDITITRAKIIVPPIRGWKRTESGKWLYMIDDINRIGYIRITGFDSRTAPDLEKVLVELESQGLKGLILDLRFNPGGLLESAIEVADKFLGKGLIVSTRPRFGVWTYAPAHKPKTHPNYPLVVLINRFTASGSEIVAGALADPQHKRAILIGERTHGKGVVLGITSHPGGGAQLKYAMAYYHLPSGQRVESQDAMKKRGRSNWGVGPNIEVKLGRGVFPSDEERKMSEVQRDNDVLVKADHDSGATPLKKHTVEETLATDPQLAVGILVIKSKLIEEGIKP